MAKTGVFGEPCVEHHTAIIYDRGGTTRLQELKDLSKVEWNRGIDVKTLGHIEIAGTACSAQKGILSSIKSRRHELVLFRGSERVWEGPVLQTSSSSNLFTLDAADVLTYWEGMALSVDWPNAAADSGATSDKLQRLQTIVEYESATPYTVDTTDGSVTVTRWEQQSPPANVLPFVEWFADPVNPAQTTVDTKAWSSTVGQHLYDLRSNGGIHFTVIGRRIIVWDQDVVIGRLRVVSERDFTGDFNVIEAGSTFATVDHVIGTQSSQDLPPVVGHGASPADALEYYGPWERVDPTTSSSANQSAPDVGALDSAAKSRIKTLYPIPIELSTTQGASLKLGPGVSMSSLVPGTQIPLVAKNNIRKVRQVQRLDTLKVTEDANGEVIATTLGAVGQVTS